MTDTEKYLKSIDKRLSEHFAPAKEDDPPECAKAFYDVMRKFLDGETAAEDMRDRSLSEAKIFEGSSGYQGLVDSANAKFQNDVAGLQQAAKAALKTSMELFRESRERTSAKPLPDDIMQQVQLFSLLQHPTASQYKKYEKIFEDYPPAMEILTSKYEFDKNSDPSYVPKDGAAVYAPTEQMDDSAVQEELQTLYQNAMHIIDGTSEESPSIPVSSAIEASKRAKDPVEMLAAVDLQDAGFVKKLLRACDHSYRPSTEQENPENEMEAKYEHSSYVERMQNEAEASGQKAAEAARAQYGIGKTQTADTTK